MNLLTQTDALNALCNSHLSTSLSSALEQKYERASWFALAIVFTTICFSSLASFWDSNDGWITGWSGHSLLFVRPEVPHSHTLGNFDTNESLLPILAGFCKVGRYWHLK